ncbi:3-isopropylmalate dehydratase small subunit [Sphingobium sp. CR2-8]|uniref:3-isopropylmalate dehydratase small subunit n=1 Tax=Sphingobium sp. CR2-8 TaxID=1306534 RepID=UPI002DBB9DD5|nr:3-isopropylmalate dehydratase small subunit [Sphingobium sp. CR2-8]MEC3911896.1 3-isopropylmalate dehydratase small subunit [Sphingobium sp. CR2-8]
MRKFTTLRGIAAALPLANVDTDKILPGSFLKTISREGLGRHLFHAMRFDVDGAERPDFVLNGSPWRNASLLITLDNFGCGSSREHAPWALADFGIRCIIAPSFADIFYNNCFKNGILPIILDRTQVDMLLALASDPRTATMSVDLPAQQLLPENSAPIEFAISPGRKETLLLGLDEIGATLALADQIDRWETGMAIISPPIAADARLID